MLNQKYFFTSGVFWFIIIFSNSFNDFFKIGILNKYYIYSLNGINFNSIEIKRKEYQLDGLQQIGYMFFNGYKIYSG